MRLPSLKNMKLNLLNEGYLLYNISNITLSSNSMKPTDFEIKFDDKLEAILLSLDEINFKLSF